LGTRGLETNRLDDQDAVARSSDVAITLSANLNWWLLRQIAQILIIMRCRSSGKRVTSDLDDSRDRYPNIPPVLGCRSRQKINASTR
jgi:hypothetical protein